MAATVEYYQEILQAFEMDEGTILVAANVTGEAVAAALEIDLGTRVDHPYLTYANEM